VHQVVDGAARRLGDPSNQDLLLELEERLGWGGLLSADHLPVRAFANRSIVHPDLVRPDSLATPAQAERLEAAIAAGQRVVIERFSSAAHHGDSPSGEQQVWPVQLLFHTIGWYLAYEEDAIGRSEGLIRTERLDRLALRRVETGFSRTFEPRSRAVQRLQGLQGLMELCGGISSSERIWPGIWPSPAVIPRRSPGSSKPCASAAPPGCSGSCARVCSASRCATPASRGPFPRIPGDRRGKHHAGSSRCPAAATPIRWRSICPPRPWQPTSTSAAGSSGSGTGS
jgi:hypothetical protein